MFLTAIAVAGVLAVGAPSTLPPPLRDGRFQVIFPPQGLHAVVLLDTQTGKTWALEEASSREGEPLAWVPIEHLDTPAEEANFYAKHRAKVPDQRPPPP